MNSRVNGQPSTPIHLPVAIYRVMARHRDQSESLVTLAENPRQAANLARGFCDVFDADDNPDGIISIWTEEWIGTLSGGKWQSISPYDGGFSRKFRTRRTTQPKSRPRSRLHAWLANGVTRQHAGTDEDRASLPRTGDKVECVLLNEQTRKGGWRAKLLKHPSAGPITNTHQVSQSVRPGQMVTLRVGAISQDGKRIQFHWRPDDNPE